jgi:hypothetical protein
MRLSLFDCWAAAVREFGWAIFVLPYVQEYQNPL